MYRFEEEDLPKVYDAEEVRAYWDARPKEVATRALEVYLAFVPYVLKLVFWEYLIRGKIADHEGLQRKYGIRLREILTDLGPCFIKLGQALSIRYVRAGLFVKFDLKVTVFRRQARPRAHPVLKRTSAPLRRRPLLPHRGRHGRVGGRARSEGGDLL